METLGPFKGIYRVIWGLYTGYAPGIFNIFPNGLNKGPYIQIFFKGF